MPVGFKDYMTVDYRPGEDDLTKYRAHKRRRGQGAGSDAEYASKNPPRVDEEPDEALSMAARRKRSRDMRKNKNKLKIARARMMKRVANPERIKKRARKQAIDMIYKKLTKGIPRKDLTPAKKAELEKRINKMKPRVNRLTRKILPQVRKAAHGK
jgi:hypothetical protein